MVGRAEVMFTDVADGDQRERTGVVRMRQIHGNEVARAFRGVSSEADALVTDERDLPIMVQTADCVPVLLATDDRVAVAHAGRNGLVEGIIPAVLGQLDGRVTAWIGPHICGRCYELPEAMADAVEAAVPGTRGTTSWGTPSADLGAGVRSQLEAAGATVHDVSVCTMEDERFYSHRRTGRPERLGGIVVLR